MKKFKKIKVHYIRVTSVCDVGHAVPDLLAGKQTYLVYYLLQRSNNEIL